jgi:hypothetical protein
MTNKLSLAIDQAIRALRKVDSILDSGDPDELGEIDDFDAEKLLDLSSLAGEVSIHADTAFDMDHELTIE